MRKIGRLCIQHTFRSQKKGTEVPLLTILFDQLITKPFGMIAPFFTTTIPSFTV
jgi:hypothetical protein